MRLPIITACRTMSRIDVAGRLVVVSIETECELLVVHTAALIFKEKRLWWAMVPGPLVDAILPAWTVREAYYDAWSAIRWQHRYHCTGCFQPDVSKRRPELQPLPRIYVHPNDHCGYCRRGEPHVHIDQR